MNKYYGLRLIRTGLIAASVIISISTIATIGGLIGYTLIQDGTFDGIGALIAILVGGAVALICYIVGQLIDVHLNNYAVTRELMVQIEEANKLNYKTIQLLTKQLRVMYSQYNVTGNPEALDDIKRIEQQIAERRSKLAQ